MYEALTWKILVFWIGGRLWEAVARERRPHMEIRLYSVHVRKKKSPTNDGALFLKKSLKLRF